MATLSFKRFSKIETLKTIDCQLLLKFLEPHREFFESRSFNLPGPTVESEVRHEVEGQHNDGQQKGDGCGPLNFNALSNILMTPDAGTPVDLADALHIIDEMSTSLAMDRLLEEAELRQIDLSKHRHRSPADLALYLWLHEPELVERKHAEHFVTRKRSYEYYQTELRPAPEFLKSDEKKLVALEATLDEWFDRKHRGRGTKIFVFRRSDGIWFMVRHGDPLRREGAMDQQNVVYRPEKYDVVVYRSAGGEIRINAATVGEKKTYREQFGKHLFGDENFFPREEKYTLEPLRTDGAKSLICVDVDELESVKLKEIHFGWGGAYQEVEVRRADDVFAVFQARSRQIPTKAKLTRAVFQVKFKHHRSPRSVTIRPPYSAQYTRDTDSALVEEWLSKRGFISQDTEAED